MSAVGDARPPVPPRFADVLAVGFGTTVAMWGAAYVCRLPAVMAPSAVLLFLLLACPVAGGFLLARGSSRGARGGLYAGLLSGLLNLLVLGSLLAGGRPNELRPSALLWIPGSIALSGGLSFIGARLGESTGRPAGEPPDWTARFARVSAAATFLLLVVGGVVTSTGSGLAVVDWPNSYGYNMFLYPLSRMTGGVYYEHAHRLIGSLVGLTTLALALHLQWADRRRSVRALSLAALVLVVAQGILGGLRVTGRLTMSASPEETAPDIRLAVVHGVLGQVFFGAAIVLSALASRLWKGGRAPLARAGAVTDRALSAFLVAALLFQLVLGAVQRHLASGLLVHITMALAVTLLAVPAGTRAWGLNGQEAVLRRLGLGVVGATAAQLALGLGTLIVTGEAARHALAPWVAVTVRTAHQANGAALLALSVLLLLWNFRLLAVRRRVPAAASS